MLRTTKNEAIDAGFRTAPIVAILGPRQCGKTTLARSYAEDQLNASQQKTNIFDLEDPTHEARLASAMLAFEGLSGLVIIDEIQRAPDLFKVLRVLVDRRPRNLRFLILGSASRDLIKQSSESLAGRIHYMELTPFQLQEVGIPNLRQLWMRGGFPLSYLSQTETDSAQWRRDYVRTFLEQDIPALGIRIPSASLRRFWTMLAHFHGQIFNASELGTSLGIADTTVRRYLDILQGTFMVRVLAPWSENLGKRQVKRPKIFFRDSGIFHTLIGADSEAAIVVNPKLGASWEGFALEECIRSMRANPEDLYFWGVHNQAELDLLYVQGTKKYGFEVKYTDKPQVTKSMRQALDDLKLDKLTVVYPGTVPFRLADKIDALPLEQANL